MLRRYLTVSFLVVVLVLSVGVHQLHAECSMTVTCLTTPQGSSCVEVFAC